MNSLKVTLLLLVLGACQAQDKDPQNTDDYVLIEFAARLEEDYQKLYPDPSSTEKK